MQCPKCPGKLETKTYGRKITVHRCDQCGGLFCKPDVLMEMKREWMSEIVLDTGSRQVGQQHNVMGDIDCPECGIRTDIEAFAGHKQYLHKENCTLAKRCESCGVQLEGYDENEEHPQHLKGCRLADISDSEEPDADLRWSGESSSDDED